MVVDDRRVIVSLSLSIYIFFYWIINHRWVQRISTIVVRRFVPCPVVIQIPPDTSYQGDGDSEIALVVEDTDMIESYMDGQPYSVSRFAATFCRQIYKGMIYMLFICVVRFLSIQS